MSPLNEPEDDPLAVPSESPPPFDAPSAVWDPSERMSHWKCVVFLCHELELGAAALPGVMDGTVSVHSSDPSDGGYNDTIQPKPRDFDPHADSTTFVFLLCMLNHSAQVHLCPLPTPGTRSQTRCHKETSIVNMIAVPTRAGVKNVFLSLLRIICKLSQYAFIVDTPESSGTALHPPGNRHAGQCATKIINSQWAKVTLMKL